MSRETVVARECSLLVFEVAGQTFAADPLDVVRVDRIQPFLPVAQIVPTESKRVLVARGRGGEFQVPVDRVRGVQRFAANALRRAPALALAVGGARAGELMGMVLDAGSPVPIVDLLALSARA
jgi:chemotaxis signal transduction protein